MIKDVQIKDNILKDKISKAIKEFQYDTGLWVKDIEVISPPPGNPDAWYHDHKNRKLRKVTIKIEVSIPEV